MDDNLSLSEEIKERYRNTYRGVFYKRYILGLWAMAEGVIYDMFDNEKHVEDPNTFQTKLNVTSEAGSEAGTTKLTVKEQLMSMRNCWKYKDAAAATAVTYGMDVKNWSKWDGESEIASTATHHITLVECDQNYKAVRSGDVAVTVNPGA